MERMGASRMDWNQEGIVYHLMLKPIYRIEFEDSTH